MKKLLIILIFLTSCNSFAGDRTIDDLVIANSLGDGREMLSAAADIVRRQRDNAAHMLEPVDVEQGLCIECDQILELTSEVEDVLRASGEAPQEVEELAVVSAYLRYVNEAGQPDCVAYQDQSWSEEFRTADLDSAIVLFTGEFDLDRLRSWHITGGNFAGLGRPGDTVFLRGRGDDHNLFVRVDLATEYDGKPKVTIYKLRNVRVDLAETPNEKRDRDNPLPSLGTAPSWRPGWQEDGVYNGSLSINPSEVTTLRIGPSLEMKDYLPKKLTLIEFKTVQQLNENNNLEVTGEVSTRRKEARFKVVGRHGEGEKLWLRVKDDGDYEVGLPYSVVVNGMPIRGGVIANDDGAGASLVINESGDSITEARYFNTRGVTSYELDYRKRLTKKTSMTFRISNENGDENAWLFLRYDLD